MIEYYSREEINKIDKFLIEDLRLIFEEYKPKYDEYLQNFLQMHLSNNKVKIKKKLFFFLIILKFNFYRKM
jgi:hypothetical protein